MKSNYSCGAVDSFGKYKNALTIRKKIVPRFRPVVSRAAPTANHHNSIN